MVADIACIAKGLLIIKEGELLRHDTPAQLLSEMQGKVLEITVPASELEEYQRKYRISNVSSDAEGFTVRILSDAPIANAIPVRPNLEDVYLHYFEE